MASASKTPNLNLPQWVGTEKPERTDFNAAFDAIDTTVASHLAESVSDGVHGLGVVTAYMTLLNSSTNGVLLTKQGSIVVVSISSVFSGTIPSGGFTTLGTIPAGFIPTSNIAQMIYQANINNFLRLDFLSSGSVRCYVYGSSNIISPYPIYANFAYSID